MTDAAIANKTSTANSSIHDELEVLFEETVDLANRIKCKARHTHRGEPLSPGGRILLQSLQLHGQLTVPALAHIRSTSRQNIQVLVNRLATAGYIEFVSNPGHKSSDLVALTANGRELLSTANEREGGLLATLLPHTTETEVRDAAELLRKLRLLLGGERKRRKPKKRSSVEAESKLTVPMPTQHPHVEEDSLPVNLL